eukprot:10064348-Ditylum_brightwellii.AAC.1
MDTKLSCSVEIYGTNDMIAKENCQTSPTENGIESVGSDRYVYFCAINAWVMWATDRQVKV